MLVIGCGCCCFFLFTDARQRMFAKQNLQQQEREAAVLAVAKTTASPKKNSVDIESTYIIRPKSIPAFDRDNIYCENRSYSAPTNAMIYHKRSTIV